MIMLTSSMTTCLGQLCWKLASVNGEIDLIFLILGFFLYGCGALLMITALRYGELSVLYPILSAGYMLSIVLGAIVLKESVAGNKILAIAAIMLGLIMISMEDKKKT